MTPAEGVVLGLVQGLTEFLPISSSGHLVIAQTLFGLEGPHLAFDVLIHGATLAAIVVWFRRRMARMALGGDWPYLGKLAVATVPIAVVGALLAPRIERAFASPAFVAGALTVTGAALLSLYLRGRPDDAFGSGDPEPTWAGALLIGLAQAAALLPGISRSGATIVAGIWLGLAPAAAAEFAFLLGVPAIAGAVVYQAGPLRDAAGAGQGLELLAGGVAAFASGVVAIAVVFRLLARRGFARFGFYCWAVAGAFAAWLAWGPR